MSLASRFLISDAFRFEIATRELFRIGSDGAATPLPLGSRAADALLVFLRRPGELVTKDQLMEAVWPNTAVDDNNLRVQISALRQALDAGRDGASAISTVPGRGYRFTLPAREVEPGATITPAAGVNPAVAAAADPTPAASVPLQDKTDTLATARPRFAGAAIWTLGIAAAAVLGIAVLVAVKPSPQPQFDLSGVWNGNDGGVYTIAQSGKEVNWEGASGDGGVEWTHTFRGEIQGKTVVGRFFDHPPGRSIHAGTLTVEIVDSNRFEKVAAGAIFIGSVWTRRPAAGR
jgi:DNA-binding winged helix-turn-helix (wHTH) protein